MTGPGYLIKDFADGWFWTPHRIAAVAALTDGHAVIDLAAKERELAGLRRQRDELHETTNRYLERARKAEYHAEAVAKDFNRVCGEKLALETQVAAMGELGFPNP